jgi:hypothetical protein
MVESMEEMVKSIEMEESCPEEMVKSRWRRVVQRRWSSRDGGELSKSEEKKKSSKQDDEVVYIPTPWQKNQKNCWQWAEAD